MRISLFLCLIKRVVLALPIEKSLSSKKFLSLPYQALGACFKSYSAFVNL